MNRPNCERSKMWKVLKVKCPKCETSKRWNVQRWNIQNVKHPKCETSKMWNVHNVKCPECEMSKVWNVQNVKRRVWNVQSWNVFMWNVWESLKLAFRLQVIAKRLPCIFVIWATWLKVALLEIKMFYELLSSFVAKVPFLIFKKQFTNLVTQGKKSPIF